MIVGLLLTLTGIGAFFGLPIAILGILIMIITKIRISRREECFKKMRSSWLFGALVCFIIGLVLTITLIGAVVGVPLIILSLILLIIGIIIPGQKKGKKI